MTDIQKKNMANVCLSKCETLYDCSDCSASLNALCAKKSFVRFTDDELIAAHAELCGTEEDEGPKQGEINDAVEHPAHYNQGGIECIEAIKAATVGKKGIEAVCTANAIKYLWRFEAKNGIEDVKKAAWFVNRLIAELEAKNE